MFQEFILLWMTEREGREKERGERKIERRRGERKRAGRRGERKRW